MKRFLDENFLLSNNTAQRLYHDYAKQMPIIDYHCHLPPDLIAKDHRFHNLTQVWLYGDHYKWRAMRTNGVSEAYITGNRSDYEKFEAWAGTVPFTMRNPLYHWTHLELQRYFGIYDLLSPSSAKMIYEECSAKLITPEYSVRSLAEKMNVEVICTTDDPIDSLEDHRIIKNSSWKVKVLPTFRPDKAMNTDDLHALNGYVDVLSSITGKTITGFEEYLSALKQRHDYFAASGCKISDHGLEQLNAEDYTEGEVKIIFKKIRAGKMLTAVEALKFKSAMLYEFALWDYEKGWVQQYHLGALRNNNSRAFKSSGADTGWDSIGDFSQAKALSRFLDRLDKQDKLAKTIIYNLNPADNEVIAAMAGNFNDGSVAGKVQFGAAWWFSDQKDGMTRQLNALSNMGLLSRLAGMLTDSRSFLSYPRHEYFRRLLCDLFGRDIENGELPADFEWTGQIIRDICYYNAKKYFNF